MSWSRTKFPPIWHMHHRSLGVSFVNTGTTREWYRATWWPRIYHSYLYSSELTNNQAFAPAWVLQSPERKIDVYCLSNGFSLIYSCLADTQRLRQNSQQLVNKQPANTWLKLSHAGSLSNHLLHHHLGGGHSALSHIRLISCQPIPCRHDGTPSPPLHLCRAYKMTLIFYLSSMS